MKRAAVLATALVLLTTASAEAKKPKPLPVAYCDVFNCASGLVASSPSGDEVVFTTYDRLTPGDHNNGIDVYERRDGRTRLLSDRPDLKPFNEKADYYLTVRFRGHDAGRPRAVFSTAMALLPEDRDDGTMPRDRSTDVYELAKGKLRLLTPAPAFPDRCAGDICDHELLHVSGDGQTYFIGTKARLTSEDTDDSQDIYSVDNEGRTLMSGGPLGGDSDSVDIPGKFYDDNLPFHFYEDGSVTFRTKEALSSGDDDSMTDAYRFANGEIERLSPPRPPGLTESQVGYRLSDEVPGRIFAIVSQAGYEDTPPPGSRTLYRVDPGEAPELVYSADLAWQHAQFAGPEVVKDLADGSVFFRTSDPIDPLDTDDQPDLYRWKDGVITMISIGPRGSDRGNDMEQGSVGGFLEVAGGSVYFTTKNKLVWEDRHSDSDLYRWSDGQVTLLSADVHGHGAGGDLFEVQALGDGDFAVRTHESWTPEDRNRALDLYRIADGRPRLISVSKGREPDAKRGAVDEFEHLGGDRFAFTAYAMTPGDGDKSLDVYFADGSRPGSTTLVSRGKLQISDGPPRTISRPGKATFTFRQSGPRPRFLCSIDERRPKRCKSPVTYRNLRPGKHSFAVASVGRHGLGRARAQSRTFNVNRDHPSEYLSPVAVSGNGRRAVVVKNTSDAPTDRDAIYLVGERRSMLIDESDERKNVFIGADPDLDRILIGTNNRLSETDDDNESDIYSFYAFDTGMPGLIPNNENIFGPPGSAQTSADAGTVAFETFASLVSTDTDHASDVYSWDQNGYRLFSGGNGSETPARLVSLSRDGSAVVFTTTEPLAPEDTDGQSSLYWSDGDSIRYLVRDGIWEERRGKLELRWRPRVAAMSENGNRVILEALKRLVTGEEADLQDWVFEWNSVSSAGPVPILAGKLASDQGTYHAWRPAVSRDASAMLITSQGQSADPGPLFRRSDGATEPVYPPRPNLPVWLNASTPGLSVVAVDTKVALDPDDQNEARDTYLLEGDEYTWLSRGRAEKGKGRRAAVIWLSSDGRDVVFSTQTPLVKRDRDPKGEDIYRYRDGELRLLTPGDRFPDRPASGSLSETFPSRNGKHFFFVTTDRLVEGDRDVAPDLYRLDNKGKLKRMPVP